MENLALIESFSEFKDEKFIDSSMVAINLDGLFVIFFKKLEKNPCCFFSNSKYILFDETKAISIPRKSNQHNK
jgi:hypothetical protein